MLNYSPVLDADAYKLFHKDAYDSEIRYVYSNFTSRNGTYSHTKDGVVFVGLQYFIIENLMKNWQKNFFDLPKKIAIKDAKRVVDTVLTNDYDMSHFEALHDLGYLPLKIKALPEGSLVPYNVPCVTITNTHIDFPWLVNYIETILSCETWGMQTTATTARAYLKNITQAFETTGADKSLIPFMCHDFSMRGMFGKHAAALSGFGHLCSFAGTDTLNSIPFAEHYYNADCTKELIGVSVPATEHSTVTSSILKTVQKYNITKLDAEIVYVRNLMEKVPTGILSHVSDSYDFWKFVELGLPLLKDQILQREGKLVIRPDSGNPVDIICGNINAATEIERKGLIEALWDIFGGTLTNKGFKVLDDHIGAIYGDSITLERQEQIIERLIKKGFAPIVVLGVGSYSYQHVTRDTHSSAIKATCVFDENKNQIDVYKDPATDTKKKSATGLLRVENINGVYTLFDKQTVEQEKQGCLETVFVDGSLIKETNLQEIRKRVLDSI